MAASLILITSRTQSAQASTWSCISLAGVMLGQGRLSGLSKAKVQGGFGRIWPKNERRRSGRLVKETGPRFLVPKIGGIGVVNFLLHIIWFRRFVWWYTSGGFFETGSSARYL